MNGLRPSELTRIALFAVLMAICAWLTIPSPVPFTLQTFGLFTTLTLLGGRNGVYAVSVYLLMGLAGLPVFSGFQGGVGVFLGPSGGFLAGFLPAALLYRGMETFVDLRERRASVLALVLGLLIIYVCGVLWFLWSGTSPDMDLWGAVSVCVLPFLVPDGCKLALALALSQRLKRRFF